MGQLMLQIYGEKKTTDLFALKDAKTNENDLDEFAKTENDIGKVILQLFLFLRERTKKTIIKN